MHVEVSLRAPKRCIMISCEIQFEKLAFPMSGSMKPQPGAGEARLGLGGPLGLPGGACRARTRALALGHFLILFLGTPCAQRGFRYWGRRPRW